MPDNQTCAYVDLKGRDVVTSRIYHANNADSADDDWEEEERRMRKLKGDVSYDDKGHYDWSAWQWDGQWVQDMYGNWHFQVGGQQGSGHGKDSHSDWGKDSHSD